MDLERVHKHRRQVWAQNVTRRALAYADTQNRFSLSVITVVELMRGYHREIDPAKAVEFRKTGPQHFELLDVNPAIAFTASEIIAKLEDRRQTIGFPDSVIAATAIEHDLILATSNERHFRRVV